MKWKSKTRILFLFFVFLIQFEISKSQTPSSEMAFQMGEKISYDVSYNVGFLWLDAGKVSFEIKKAYYAGKKVFHFYSFGTSLPAYDWFFKVRDVWESYSDTAVVKPYMFKRNSFEGGYWVNNEYWFDYNNNKIYTESANSNKKLVRDTFPIQNSLVDLVSGLYYVRNLDFSRYAINDKIDLKFIVDNEIFDDLYARFMGTEIIELRDGRKFYCYKLRPYLVEGTMFSGGEKMTVWISTDGNNLPVLVEAQVLVGSIKAELSDVKALKYPLKPNLK